MITRYHVTLGAKTTAGGIVVSASSARSIEGVKVAVEDDKIHCLACKAIGVIKPDGPRLRETCDGKQVALQDDLCICKCAPPPRLIANQSLARQTIDGEWHAAEVSRKVAAIGTEPATGKDDTDELLPLLLVNPSTEEPFKYRPYRLEFSSNREVEGTTDEHGATRPLTAAERNSLVAWHVSDETGLA
jgi:uncharacterized Zn-binding protein involved in type VI secretion